MQQTDHVKTCHRESSLKLKKKSNQPRKCRTQILHIIDKTILITTRHVLQYELTARSFAISCTRNLFFQKEEKEIKMEYIKLKKKIDPEIE